MKKLIIALSALVILSCSDSDDDDGFGASLTGIQRKALTGYLHTYAVVNMEEDSMFLIKHETVNDEQVVFHLDTLLKEEISDRKGSNENYPAVAYRWASKNYIDADDFETEFPCMEDEWFSRKTNVVQIGDVFYVQIHKLPGE